MLMLNLLSAALAGGFAEPVRVDAIHKDGSATVLTLSGGERMFAECPAFTVRVEHEWVPWYGWVPGVSTSHPSPSQTADALALLAAHHQDGTPVAFGEMGRGLEALRPCAYASRGLDVYDGGVYSFYNPV